MIKKIPFLRLATGYPYLVSYPNTDYTLFNQSLNECANITYIDTRVYETDIPGAYGRYYSFEDSGLDNNIVYDINHNGRYHFQFKGLKYLSNISDLWYMNAVLIGYNNSPPPINNKDASGVSLQSFANINLGVDAAYLAIDSIKPTGKTVSEGLFDSGEVGIRLVMFVNKLDLIERTVGNNKIKNLQFHYTIRAYLIDSSLGGQYSDFTNTSLLGEKSFYYEQTIPTYLRSNFTTKNSLKTGWGHFLYPVTTNDKTDITYVQLSDVLKTIYNGMIFSQSTDNLSLRIDSSVLLNWLNTDITLRNASEEYEPSSVVPKQVTIPTFAYTESNVLEDWLSAISAEAATRGRPDVDLLMSYDNIYWEPFSDLYSGDIYSNSPSIFMTRLTTYYQGSGQSPIDEPGNLESNGGFIKARRKYFLSNLIQYVVDRSPVEKGDVSPYLNTSNPERFIGSKFFPFYKFKQYKNNSTGKELLDLITVPFSTDQSVVNIIECETSTDLKKVVSDNLNQYRRKIITKPDLLPNSLGSTTTDRINSIGYVEYIDNDGGSEVILLNSSAGAIKNNVFSFLTWIFMAPGKLGNPAQWTRNGRYFTRAKDMETKSWLGYESRAWDQETACSIVKSGMYDTPELAYSTYKRVIDGIFIGDPSPNNPAWNDFYVCIPATRGEVRTTEYCDPSPAPDGRQIIRRIKIQQTSTSASGVVTNIGNPTYEYPVTTFILKDQTQIINGKTILGERMLSYKDCSNIEDKFNPYQTSPTGPVIVTGPNGEKKKEVDLSLEDFINPAVFKINIITLNPSPYYIGLNVEKSYYKLEFSEDEIGNSALDYRIKISPGKRGQVLVLEINNLIYPFLGVTLTNGELLTGNSGDQRVIISTDQWGNEKYNSRLFLVYDGKDWIEFLRRDIY